MDTKSIHIELIARKQKLEQAACALKEKFLGLDEIIDEVMSLLMPWYLFPKAQLRPTVINLWGLTGSGKTALVQTLVELLEYQKLYSHIDMGEFESDSASWMKNILTDDLSFFHEKSPIICLDEFQFARTLDNNGNELGKDKLRVIWDLLDSGKIQYIPNSSTYYLFRADNGLKRLEKLVKESVALQDGIVTNGVEHFVKAFEGFYFDYNDRSDAVISPSYFVTDDFINGMFHLFDDDDFSKEQLRARIKSSTLEELIILVKQGMHTRPASKTLDLSHSLMFVLGNLDEAYSMSHNMNPDISADEFHEATAKITIADIKRALRKRFRPEQIARLGNNHIIYKSFNCAQFRALIRQELRRIQAFVNNQFGWKVIFDESVVNIVYAEGVFPAQGTRPVFTTVKNLIESKVSSLVVSILEYQLEPVLINWKFDNGQFAYEVLDEKSNVVLSFSDQAKLKLENLRRSVDPQIQAHTAVHEAGHAVLAALTLRIIPSVVVSRTASDMEGFCLVNFPKGPMTRESLKKDIVITLGGYVAEKMIFGEEFTSSGVYSDIEEASRLANKAVRNYAMGSDPIHLAIGTQNEDAFTMSQKYSAEAVAIIKECEVEAERLLQKNKLLLLKIADYLTTHSRMEEQMIVDYVRDFAVESWIESGFIKKDNYYQFNTILQDQLSQLENKDFSSVVERMVAVASEEVAM
ncbi:MAG TPA: hypothetical protein VD884_11615 [Ohtaekwangia sp.]|nr:hypothetical protein [Ohtaekwangia sp.]